MAEYIISEKALEDLNSIWVCAFKNTEIEVVRILHEKMDIKNRIND